MAIQAAALSACINSAASSSCCACIRITFEMRHNERLDKHAHPASGCLQTMENHQEQCAAWSRYVLQDCSIMCKSKHINIALCCKAHARHVQSCMHAYEAYTKLLLRVTASSASDMA